MNTPFQRGNRITYTNAGSAILSGAVVAIVTGASGFIGIAVTDIAASTGTGEVAIGGGDERVATLTKVTGQAFTQGQALFWDVTNSRLTSSSTGNTRAGRAAYAATSAATTAQLIINQY